MDRCIGHTGCQKHPEGVLGEKQRKDKREVRRPPDTRSQFGGDLMAQKRNRRADKFVYEEGDLVFEDDPEVSQAVDEDSAWMGPVHPLGRIEDEEDLPLIVESEFTTEQQETYKDAFNEALDAISPHGPSLEKSLVHASNVAWKSMGVDPSDLIKWLQEHEDAFSRSTPVETDANVVQRVMAKAADEETYADPGRAGRNPGEESRS